MDSLTHRSMLECNQYFLVLLNLVYISASLPERNINISAIFCIHQSLQAYVILKTICATNIIILKTELNIGCNGCIFAMKTSFHNSPFLRLIINSTLTSETRKSRVITNIQNKQVNKIVSGEYLVITAKG